MSTAALRERLVDSGAVYARIGAVEVARHYGDVGAEYETIRARAGIVQRADRARIRMWGRDPARMLNGLITNDLGLLAPDRSVYAAILTPKGRVISDLRAFSLPAGEVGVDIAADALPAVSEHLKKYVPPLFARWEAVGEGAGVLGVYGPESARVVEAAIGVSPDPTEDRISRGGVEGSEVLAIATRYAGGETGFDLLADAAVLPSLWDGLVGTGASLGARPVGFAALEVLRIEAGEPRYGAEVSEEVLPGEVFGPERMERAVSFTKGCYTGQEVVIRIAHRGHVNRHLRGLLLGEQPALSAGTPLVDPESGKEVGRTTSSVESPLVSQTIALAYVRREIPPGGRVRLGDAEGPDAVVVELPFRA
jgi:folate-binding protein YgfZ